MPTLALLGIRAGSIALLLLLIIRWQVHAFVAMMLVSFLVAFATGSWACRTSTIRASGS